MSSLNPTVSGSGTSTPSPVSEVGSAVGFKDFACSGPRSHPLTRRAMEMTKLEIEMPWDVMNTERNRARSYERFVSIFRRTTRIFIAPAVHPASTPSLKEKARIPENSGIAGNRPESGDTISPPGDDFAAIRRDQGRSRRAPGFAGRMNFPTDSGQRRQNTDSQMRLAAK